MFYKAVKYCLWIKLQLFPATATSTVKPTCVATYWFPASTKAFYDPRQNTVDSREETRLTTIGKPYHNISWEEILIQTNHWLFLEFLKNIEFAKLQSCDKSHFVKFEIKSKSLKNHFKLNQNQAQMQSFQINSNIFFLKN